MKKIIIQSEDVFQHKHKVLSIALEQVTQVIDLNSNDETILEIDGFAKEIWSALDGRKSLQKIVSRLQKNLSIEPKDLTRFEEDAFKFVGELHAQGLISKLE
jgi:hypothetical protein